jgi:hypothetical protein
MSVLTPATRQLVELMGAAPRGPRRDGLFALWLTVRVLEDFDQSAANDRATRRRVGLLERRLSSLTLAPALKRGLGAAIAALKENPHPDLLPGLLGQLAGSAREALGVEASEALHRSARTRR